MNLLKDLTLKDNFMFGAVMIRPKNCRPLLERILGIPIERIIVSKEKSMIYHPEYKGIRLDIIAKDKKNTRYNVEMQVVRKPALGRRSRYYHSQIDMELLASGAEYAELPDTYVIFICDFDPFGLDKYRYTFRNVCLEAQGLSLPDGYATVFLNTHGTNEKEVPKDLVTLLKYIGSDLAASQADFGDSYIGQLQRAVRKVKSSREMEARYMLLQEMLKDEWKAGHAEGLREGHVSGLKEGHASGLKEGRASGLIEGHASGLIEGRARDVLALLSLKPGSIPDELRTHILSLKDEAALLQYLKAASSANSVEEFERLILDASHK